MPDAFYTGQTDYLSKLNTLWNYYSGGTQGYPSLHETSGRIYTGATDNGSTHFQINGSMLATGQVSLGGGVGSESLRAPVVASAVNRIEAHGATTGNSPTLRSVSTTAAGFQLQNGNAGPILFQTDGVAGAKNQFRVGHIANSVGYLEVRGSTTGQPAVLVSGGEANTGMYLATSGTGGYQFTTGTGTVQQFGIGHVASAIAYLQVGGAATGQSPFIGINSSEANTSLNIGPKARGNLGVNWGLPPARLSVGAQSVTATTVSTISSVNTSTDTVTTSAAHNFTNGDAVFYKTTANGINIAGTSATDRWLFVNAPTTSTLTFHATLQDAISGTSKLDISADGTGTQTLSGASLIFTGSASLSGNGSNIDTLMYRHTAGSDWTGVTTRIQARTDNTSQGYLEFNPIGNNYGTKLGATNAGNIQLSTGGGEQLRIANIAATVNYGRIRGGSVGTGVIYETEGSDTNIVTNIGSKGTGSVSIFTEGYINGVGKKQVDIIHSANAVNWMQLAGGASGIPPSLSSRGEGNLGCSINSNGTGSVFLTTGGSSYTAQLEVYNTTSATNRLQVSGAATGGRVTIQAGGSVDTNRGIKYVVAGTEFHDFYVNSSTQFSITGPSTAVNSLRVQGGTTGNRASIESVGSANTGMTISATGSELIDMRANGGSCLVVGGGGINPINYIQARGSITGVETKLTAEGADSNISMVLQPKGTGFIAVQSDSFRVTTPKTPGSATAAGTQGQICWDSSFVYVCVATNSWKRSAIAAW